MRHEEERPLERLQRIDEGLDGLEIEVVRRLVEDEDVGLIGGDAAEDEARGLAAGERGDALLHVVAGEEDAAEVTAHEGVPLARAHGPERVERGRVRVLEDLAVILREVAHAGLVAPARLALVGVEAADEDAQEGRFSEAVRPDHANALAAAHDERDVAEDLVIAVRLRRSPRR